MLRWFVLWLFSLTLTRTRPSFCGPGLTVSVSVSLGVAVSALCKWIVLAVLPLANQRYNSRMYASPVEGRCWYQEATRGVLENATRFKKGHSQPNNPSINRSIN